MKPERLQNLVGALALRLSDEIAEGAESLAPRDEPAAAIALIGRSPGWTIRYLSEDLGLSHAATVRLVDRLVGDGLMMRAKSTKDARAVELSLTPAGQEIYQRILDARHERLAVALSCLSDAEKDALGAIADKLLAAVAKGGACRSRICRFCDVQSCKTCPIDEALATAATATALCSRRSGASD
ncbi:MarR family winged helix-turn-helix transcriptional regulator [Litchfieldella rifensis]|uniref:MarR family winged helix-turn-helix transcriptional regulator n=1 Tax=Litchfieldella rifensis TaxID=762643 RepID=A0ABV7LIX4_9GAMM